MKALFRRAVYSVEFNDETYQNVQLWQLLQGSITGYDNEKEEISD